MYRMYDTTASLSLYRFLSLGDIFSYEKIKSLCETEVTPPPAFLQYSTQVTKIILSLCHEKEL